MKILIIGGGWAGIAAAVCATERGHHVTLVEERPYLGGRARSFSDRVTGHHIDNGQHVLMGCYHAVLHVLDVLGTRHLLEQQQALRVSFVDASRRQSVLDASRLPGKLGMFWALHTLKGVAFKSRMACATLSTAIALGKASGKGLTCAQLFAKYNQPNDIVARFWEPLVLATLNAPIDAASAELLVAVMKLGVLGSTSDATLLVPSCGLSDLIEPLAPWLTQHGCVAFTSVSVDRLNLADGRCTSAELSDGTVVECDAVVSSTPQKALQRLLDASGVGHHLPPPSEMSPIISVYLWYDVQWMREDFTAALGTTIQWIFDKRRIAPGLVALTVSAGNAIVNESSEAIIALCDAELRRLFSAMQGASLVHGIVIKEKSATPLLTPSTARASATHMREQVQNLALAGDWTSTGLPATLEGAARSGVAAIDIVERG